MVLAKVKESEKIANTIESMTDFIIKGAFVLGVLLFLEKIVGLGFDINIGLGL